MENVNHAELHAAITYGKHPDIYPIKLGGLDTLIIDAEDAQKRVLRSTLNEYMGSRVLTLHLKEGEKIRIVRQLYGLAAVGLSGTKTYETKTYGVHGGNLYQLEEHLDGTLIDPVKSMQYQAYIYFVNAILGGHNVATWYDNTNVDAVRFSDTFSLNEESLNTSMIYRVSNPRSSNVMSSNEVLETRKRLGDGKDQIPEGVVYFKNPLKGREIKICGNPSDLEKYLNGLSKSADFLIHRLDDNYYAILPNIKL